MPTCPLSIPKTGSYTFNTLCVASLSFLDSIGLYFWASLGNILEKKLQVDVKWYHNYVLLIYVLVVYSLSTSLVILGCPNLGTSLFSVWPRYFGFEFSSPFPIWPSYFSSPFPIVNWMYYIILYWLKFFRLLLLISGTCTVSIITTCTPCLQGSWRYISCLLRCFELFYCLFCSLAFRFF